MISRAVRVSIFFFLSAIVFLPILANARKNIDYTKDYYGALGVDPEANAGEIKKAYYKLSKIWHPDKNKHKDAVAKFREIAAAYEVLSDPELRQDYDRVLLEGGPPEDWDINFPGASRSKYGGAAHHRLGPTLFAFAMLISVMQYLYLWYTYHHKLEGVKASRGYKLKLEQLIAEQQTQRPNRTRKKAKGRKGDDSEDERIRAEAEKKIQLQIDHGPPKITQVFIVAIVLFPVKLKFWMGFIKMVYLQFKGIIMRYLTPEERFWLLQRRHPEPIEPEQREKIMKTFLKQDEEILERLELERTRRR
mmetsp:Transcript_41054/g.66563  ORF Transcript_41054/g.66563 Transcript_41054/m.66563 type:complete len:305 (+) Transcript_41054:166-1080(+)|eukprot:CAMPEP_0184653654 /NCGR_PEP_ID=MMETSP0308-20130426/11383_1 /TAXON_ID=38269 /ORGANISM="Gloeochaete witrockiana, Strain SAG 46.84" /LENGTH=304 /DNA_ID=CAMNT_0027089241 /DNA_START=71 /DNA_END=985 /DNA_ORIENTATION=-